MRARQRSYLGRIATRSRARRSVKGGGSRDCQKASCVFHRLATSWGEPRSPSGSARTAGKRDFGLASAVVSVSSVEGTSGLADPALLRGRTGEAALGPGCVRASDTRMAPSPVLSRRGWCGGIAVVLESPTSTARSHDERCPRGSGWGHYGSPALVRACGSRRTGLRSRLDLTRETSAGGCRRRGAGSRPRSSRRTAPPVLGAGKASGAASATPVGAASVAPAGAVSAAPIDAIERSAQAHAGSGSVHGAGIRWSAVVLADRMGCRSRRAALGPSRKAMGLARWLPAQAGELRGRKRAGSRVAVAKATSTRAATPVAGSL